MGPCISILGVPAPEPGIPQGACLKVTAGGHTHSCLGSHKGSFPWAGKEDPTPLEHFKGLDGS